MIRSAGSTMVMLGQSLERRRAQGVETVRVET